jgi:hypothetical protein
VLPGWPEPWVRYADNEPMVSPAVTENSAAYQPEEFNTTLVEPVGVPVSRTKSAEAMPGSRAASVRAAAKRSLFFMMNTLMRVIAVRR